MFWGVPGLVLARKSDLYKLPKKGFFGDPWGVCSFSRRIRPSGSDPKINFDTKFDPGPASPGLGGFCRDTGFRYLE